MPTGTPERPAWRLLLGYVRGHTATLAAGAALGLVGGLAGLAQPLMAKVTIDALGSGQALALPLLVLTGLVVAGAVSMVAGRYLLERAAEQVVLAARVGLITRLLRLRVGTVDRLNPGDLLSRVTSDTTLLRNVCTHGLVGGVNAVFMLAGSIVLMAVLDLMLLAVALAVVCVAGGLIALVMARIGAATHRSQAAVGEMAALLERALGAFRTVKASGAEEREAADLGEAARQACRQGINAAGWTSLATVAAPLAVQLSFLVVLGVGGARVATGALPVSTMIAFLLYLFYLLEPLGALVDAATQTQVGLAALRRIRHVHRLPREPLPREPLPCEPLPCEPLACGPPAESARTGPAAVTFTDVCFRYRETGPLVHDNITLAVPPGGLTALVGPSGAGKSTVFALLERFYDPQSGTIALDGHDLDRWPLAALRGTIGYVEQDAPILAGTLRDNLRYAAPAATDEQIHLAAARTQLADLLGRLPDGLDSTIGHRGSTLSGGERQRIAIARALLRQPRLLLLDEATSQLDAANEAALRAVMTSIARTTTVIVIAHRLSTVVAADQIVLMTHGHIRATGTHAHLLATDSLYRSLATTQLLTADDAIPAPPPRAHRGDEDQNAW